MCDNKIKRFELVELTVPAGSTGRVIFQSIPQLRNQANQIIVIKDIFIYTDSVYKNSQTNNTIPGFPAAELSKCVLTLYVNGEESIKQIPLAELNHIRDTVSNPFQFQLEGLADLSNVDFDKSYVQYNAASAGTTYIIPFGIKYLRFMADVNGNMVQQ